MSETGLKATLYYNKSDKRYLNKEIEQIGNEMDITLIEPISIINPTFILSNASRVREANYIFVPKVGRYYYIEDYIFEYDRIIINCKVDVLMSFRSQIVEEEIIIERSSYKSKQNFYLPDNEVKEYAYPYTEVHKLKCISNNGFDQKNNYYILALSGAVPSTQPEEGD